MHFSTLGSREHRHTLALTAGIIEIPGHTAHCPRRASYATHRIGRYCPHSMATLMIARHVACGEAENDGTVAPACPGLRSPQLEGTQPPPQHSAPAQSSRLCRLRYARLHAVLLAGVLSHAPSVPTHQCAHEMDRVYGSGRTTAAAGFDGRTFARVTTSPPHLGSGATTKAPPRSGLVFDREVSVVAVADALLAAHSLARRPQRCDVAKHANQVCASFRAARG